jgi:hypothetical protein
MNASLQPGTAKKLLAPIRRGLIFAAFGVFFMGIIMYAFFRAPQLLVYNLTGKPGFLDGLYHPLPKDSWLLNFAVYSIPDGFWLLSCILCLRALWLENARACGLYIRMTWVLAMLFELCQLPGLIPGTFDLLDLCAMGLAAFGEGIFYISVLQRRIGYAYQS